MKAQVQMGESITIMIIVILLVVFGFVFYTKWTAATIHATQESSQEENAFALATLAANLPELHCSKNNVVELNCYDVLKVKHFKTITQGDGRFYYNSLFGNARIQIYEIYPDGNEISVFNSVERNSQAYAEDPSASRNPDSYLLCRETPSFFCVVYDSRPAEVRANIPARIPVRLYNPINESVKLGVIEVVRYFS